MSGPKFSLTFTRRVERRKLEPSTAIRSSEITREQSTNPAPQTLHVIEGNSLKIDETEAEKQELVIPLVQDDRIALLKKAQELAETDTPTAKKLKAGRDTSGNDDGQENKKGEKKGGETEPTKALTLEEQAATALIEESQRKLESWQERDKGGNLTISAASTSSNLDVSQSTDTRVKEASLDDYEEITVSSFGAAMLRGMGWKKGEGVGRIGKRVVEIIDPATLTYTLSETRKKQGGEGQEATNTQRNGQQEEQLPMVKGAHVYIHGGRQKGVYGVVETVDEDHVLVKAAVSGNIIREVELNLRIISQQEFKESSRVINKDMYDKYKEEEARKKSDLKRKSKTSDSRDSKREGSSEEMKKKQKFADLPERGNQDSKTHIDKYQTDGQGENTRQNIKSKHRSYAEDKGIRDSDREEKHRDRHKHRSPDEESAERRHAERDDASNFNKSNKSKYRDFKRDEDEHIEKQSAVRKDGDERFDEKSGRSRHLNDGDSKSKLKEGREREGEHGYSKSREKRDSDEDDGYGKSKEIKKENEYYGYSKVKERRDWEERGSDRKSNVRKEEEGEYAHNKFQGSEKEMYNKLKSKKEREEEYGHKKSKGREEENYYRKTEKKVGREVEKRQVKPPVAMPWVRENLRVRLINKTYRGGRHHKEKVVVRSVVTAERCECETEDGKLLLEVHPAWLETVIPKVPPHLVMIVRGHNKGQVARILQLHKEQEKASLQLLEEETTLLKLHYDDISEYVRQ
ncbi:hypothetical protein Pmani_000082 [Petrolisthes manimaculis]|uniref:G-patch domain-containing protein n=1 Tax=Petrolisthes manimaculis TaxID=1843537 RepID=A0AAE1QPW6_9EUCA|nr:hypothetical protein Pmani_000082 [Petrolisthes manimaculis]